MRRTIGIAVVLLGSVALLQGEGHAQTVKQYAAPANCEWRKLGPGFTLYCHSDPEPIDPADAERDALLARAGMVRVLPPEWNEALVPSGFDETTVDRANAGDVPAMRMVGIFHLADGTTASAVPWLQKAGDAGDAEAARQLGTLYHWGLAVPRDDARARDWFVKAAQAGDSWAMHWLGELYLSGGKGLASDPAQAAHWFRPAADAGDAAAMFRLAGLTRDPADARGWLEKAARSGFEAAVAELERRGLPVPAAIPVAPLTPASGPPPECTLPASLRGTPFVEKLSDPDNERFVAALTGAEAGDKVGAVCWARRAALRGSGYATNDLAEAYYTYRAGPPGMKPRVMIGHDNIFAISKNDADAVPWLALAARSSERFIPGPAMEMIGNLYASGIVVDRNDVEAVRWYRLANAKDGFFAPMSLAYMYHGGFGVVRDDSAAMKLLLDDIGLASNRTLYGAMIANGMPALDARWTAEAIGLAAEADYVEAVIALGQRFANGDGFAKDMKAARRCFARAAKLGDPRGAAQLAKLPAPGTDKPPPSRDFGSTPIPACQQ